ncbi:MAG: phosphoribosylanthranilate isomerase [Kiritimatiellae bacterium]|nr:phosphoribosylanthranilate isomerase [Kiritimatiellia bacterium]
MLPELKICGINDLGFAIEAEKSVDYLGFIFAKKSPRYVTPEEAAKIIAALSGKAKKVGVFVSFIEAKEIASEIKFDVIQLHFRAKAEEVEFFRLLGFEVWTLAGGAEGDGVLFDSSHGDGETELRQGAYKAILAGKIGPENFAAAIKSGADILDMNSALEEAPGRKSLAKLNELQRLLVIK